jgi:hypothetical protein
MTVSEQQNLTQDRHLAIAKGAGRVVTRTYRDPDGTIHVEYQDGATLLVEVGQEPVLTPAS